jgi:hypothetical protein
MNCSESKQLYLFWENVNNGILYYLYYAGTFYIHIEETLETEIKIHQLYDFLQNLLVTFHLIFLKL